MGEACEDGGMRKKTSARQYHNVSEQARLLAAWQRSGLTDKAFATQQGVGLSTLYSWRRRQRARVEVPRLPLVEIPNFLTKPQPAASYRLHLPGDRILELTRNFEPSEVRVLAQLLQSL